MKLGELFMSLGFRVDDDNLKQFNNEVSALKKRLMSLPVIVTAVAFAIDKFTASSVNGAVAVQNFTAQTGLLGSELQKYQIAGQLSDIALSSEQVTGSITNLQSQLAQIRLGGGNIQAFQLSGIDVIGKDAFQVIEELRSRFRAGLMGDRATATNLLAQMGLGAEFIRIIELSREEFDALGESFIRSPKLIRGLERMGTAITKFKMSLSFLKDTFNGLISDFVTGFFTVLTNGTNLFTNLIEGIVMLTEKFSFLGDGLKGLGILILGLIAIFNPWKTLLVGALLLVEDLIVFFQDGDSIIGRFIDKLKSFGTEIKNFFKGILDWIMDLIVKPIEKIEAFGAKIKSIFTMSSVPEDTLVEGIGNIKGGGNSNNVVNTTINIMAETAEDVVDAISRAGDSLSNKLAVTYDEITAGDAN